MNYVNNEKTKNSIIKSQLIWSFIGLILVFVNIWIPTGIKYPVFIPFETEAPGTVSMVIDRLIGNDFCIDIFSDIIGLIILIVLCCIFKNQMTIHEKGRRTVWMQNVPFLILALAFDVVYKILPFYLNGNLRFRICYVMYFVMTMTKIFALFFYTRCFLDLKETYATHSATSLSWIFLAVSYFCGAIRYIMHFFDIPIIVYIYLAAQIILLCVVFYRISKTIE